MSVREALNLSVYNFRYMQCPKCGCDHLRLKETVRFERVLICFTGKRQFLCWRCGHAFRAPDNRLMRLESSDEENHETLIRRPIVAPYLVALASVFIAIVLSSVAVLYNGKTPLAFLVVALIFSAGRGPGPGLLATVVSFGAMLSILKGNLAIPLAAQSMVALFVVIALVINLVCYELHRKNAELTKKNRALSRAKEVIETVNQNLVDHAELLAEANAMLAEERSTLLRAHEQLRLLGHELAKNIRPPLTRISSTTEMLAQSDAARDDVALIQASRLIKTEVRRLDTLASEFSQVC